MRNRCIGTNVHALGAGARPFFPSPLETSCGVVAPILGVGSEKWHPTLDGVRLTAAADFKWLWHICKVLQRRPQDRGGVVHLVRIDP